MSVFSPAALDQPSAVFAPLIVRSLAFEDALQLWGSCNSLSARAAAESWAVQTITQARIRRSIRACLLSLTLKCIPAHDL